jgi:hypothetical protein
LPRFFVVPGSFTNNGVIARYTVCIIKSSAKEISLRASREEMRGSDAQDDWAREERDGEANAGPRFLFDRLVSRSTTCSR